MLLLQNKSQLGWERNIANKFDRKGREVDKGVFFAAALLFNVYSQL